MKCPDCGLENSPSRKYCYNCGSLLLPNDGKPAQSDSKSIDFQYIQSEVRQLRDQFAALDSRLKSLEDSLGPEPGVEESTPGSLAFPAGITPEPEISIPLKSLDEESVLPLEREPVAEVKTSDTTPPPIPPPYSTAESRPPRNMEWEQILGGNWLARIGILAVIIGAAFFLKFAFDKDWLGPTARVILGVVAGLVLLGLGYYWKKRYPVFAQALSGGGIALLYLSIFAAGALFGLLGFYGAVVLLLFISAGSALLALRYNSMAMAILGIVGAFAAPFLLGASDHGTAAATSRGSGVMLLVYIIVVDIGVLALSTFRNWRWFTLFALLSSLISYGIWYSQYGQNASLLTAELSLTIIFLIFVGTTVLYLLIWRRPAEVFDYSLMLINAAAYFGISQALMSEQLQSWMGGFSLLVALFYGGLAYYASTKGKEHDRLAFFSLGIGLVFLTVAIPIQFGDRAWTTIAWAVEGIVYIWLYSKLSIPYFRYGCYGAFLLMMVRLLFFDSWIPAYDFVPVLNERVLAFICGIAATYFAGYLIRKEEPELYPVFFIISNVLVFWITGVETIQYLVSRPFNDLGILTLAFFIIAAGWLALHHLVWRRSADLFDRILWPVNAAFFLLLSIPLWWEFRAWMGLIYLILAAIFGLQTLLLRKKEIFSRWLGSAGIGIPFTFFTLAILAQFGNQAWTTVCLAVEMVVLGWLSLVWRLPQLRSYSYLIFALVGIRLIFFDTFNVLSRGSQPYSYTPVLNERVLAFLVSIAAIYLSVYISWKYWQMYPEWNKLAPIFLGVASLFTVWVISFEVWNYFDRHLVAQGYEPGFEAARSALKSAQRLSLTGVWALYALLVLVIGIRQRLRIARIGALSLLGMAVVKVFVYDVFVLEQVYRIIAFTGLGVLLIVSGYLYHRYSQAIKDFLVDKEPG